MSTTPVLCIQVNAEIHLRLLEERHLWDYFALIERNQGHLREWTAEEAYEGSIETPGASVKQHLLRFTEVSPGDLISGSSGRRAGLSPEQKE
jgi:hypothetical protein